MSYAPLPRPGPQPHNHVAPTFEEQLARAVRPRRRRKRLPRWVRQMRCELRELSAAYAALEEAVVRHLRKPH